MSTELPSDAAYLEAMRRHGITEHYETHELTEDHDGAPLGVETTTVRGTAMVCTREQMEAIMRDLGETP